MSFADVPETVRPLPQESGLGPETPTPAAAEVLQTGRKEYRKKKKVWKFERFGPPGQKGKGKTGKGEKGTTTGKGKGRGKGKGWSPWGGKGKGKKGT